MGLHIRYARNVRLEIALMIKTVVLRLSIAAAAVPLILHVEYAERRKEYGILFMFQPVL